MYREVSQAPIIIDVHSTLYNIHVAKYIYVACRYIAGDAKTQPSAEWLQKKKASAETALRQYALPPF